MSTTELQEDLYAGYDTVLDDTQRLRPNIYESRLRLLHKALTTTPDGVDGSESKIG